MNVITYNHKIFCTNVNFKKIECHNSMHYSFLLMHCCKLFTYKPVIIVDVANDTLFYRCGHPPEVGA